MRTIIVHKHNVRIDDYQRGLKYENLEPEDMLWDQNLGINAEIFNANLIIIALQSPDVNILANILPELKIKKQCLPIIVIDEIQNDETKHLALSLGAYDYLPKPIQYRDLAITIKHLAFKTDQPNNKCLHAFDIKLDLEHRFVKRAKYIFPLRNKEFALLEFFIINKGKILTRNSIMEHVWDRNANFASNTVDVHINRLRRKIDDPFREKLIHTVPCIGYIFEKRKKSRVSEVNKTDKMNHENSKRKIQTSRRRPPGAGL